MRYIKEFTSVHIIKTEVTAMADISQQTIKDLFYKQVREMTKKSSLKMNLFDVQFSDKWI